MKSLQTYLERASQAHYLHHADINKRFLNPWEVWYVKLWCNIGNEIDWKKWFVRPVLVLRVYGNTVICLPMSSKIKQTSFQYHLSDTSALLLDQIKSFDKKRFIKHVSTIPHSTLLSIKKATKELLLW